MNFIKELTIFLILIFGTLTVFAQTTAFSYQGRLNEMGSPVSGTRYFRFTLFDENGAAIPGATVEQTLTVTNGVFNATLDFGAANFSGANRSLQISVKINAGDAFTDLSPRQDILAAPYSIKSKSSDNAAQLGGVNSANFVQQDAGGNVAIAGNFTVNGSLSLNTINAATQYNLGGQRILGNAGNSNLFAGTGAGATNSGSFNTFIGNLAGNANTTGYDNAFFGTNAGLYNTTGQGNSFFGAASGDVNTTGSFNSFFGLAAGELNNGNNNSFFGRDAGTVNTTGDDNAFFGKWSGVTNSTGAANTFIGTGAGAANTVGGNNTIIGADANVGANNLTNATALGANATVTQNNSVILGSNASVGIGTTAPKAKLDVNGGNILVGSPGQGIVLKSPDGATCKLLSIDNAGAMVLTSFVCP